MNEKRWRRRRYWCLEGGANDKSSVFHGGADKRWADNVVHGAPEKEDLSNRIQSLIFDYVLGDVGIFGATPAGEDDEFGLAVCASARARN